MSILKKLIKFLPSSNSKYNKNKIILEGTFKSDKLNKKVEKNGKKILYFEGDQFIAEMYKTKLEGCGYNCVVLNKPPVDKERLIQLILNENPDLILTQIIMSGMDGFTEIETLKSDNRTKNFSIMIYSNLGRSEDIKKGIKLGAIDYFVPATLTPQEMVDAINRFFKDRKNYKSRYLNFIDK